MARTFEFNADTYFAGLRQSGLAISAEQEAIARRVIDEENTSGDFFTMVFNAIMSAARGVVEFINSGDANTLGERFTAAMENGQQRGDMNTAALVSHRIRAGLIANGIPTEMAEVMTGDTTNRPEIPGNLYRIFSAGVSDDNRDAEREYQNANAPQPIEIAAATRFPVTDNPTVTAPIAPLAVNSTRTLTGNAPAA